MKILKVTSRTISIELENDYPYGIEDHSFDVYLNGKLYQNEYRNVFTIVDLTPSTKYELRVGNEKIRITTLKESACYNVLDFHAYGDGVHDDTTMIQAAIMCCPAGGTVYLPKKTYLISSIFLKSDMMLYFEKGAKIITKYERSAYPIYPKVTGYGVWEGSLVDNFVSSINLLNVHNVIIAGAGEIDEQAILGDWYENHREKKIAWRGYGIYIAHSTQIDLIGFHIHDTPSWNIHPFLSKKLNFINLKIENPLHMPTTDGLDPDCCEDILICGCTFNVGDDCIAIKSGTIELAKKLRKPSKNILIRNNLMLCGHGGVVFGSECSAGIQNVVVEQCIFKNTDRGFRIKTRRGRGAIGSIDNITFRNIIMEKVKVPFVINMFYNMGPAGGHEEYVWTTKALPVDENTPMIGHFKFSHMICKDVGYAAGVFLGLPESMIAGIELDDVEFSYDLDCEEGCPVMIEHPFTLKNAGLYCMNVGKIVTNHVHFKNVCGDEIIIVEKEDENNG